MAPNTHYSLFPICHFVCTTCITPNLQVIYGRSTYQTTALLLEVSILAACKIWLPSLGSKHTWQSVSNKPFRPTYVHNFITVQVIHGCSTYWMAALQSETSLCVLELHERSDWRATAPKTHHSHCLIQLCIHILHSIRTLLFGAHITHDNKTHMTYDYTTHQTMALLPTIHHLIATTSYVMTFEQLKFIASTYTLKRFSSYSRHFKHT